MINELSELSRAMKNLELNIFHSDYRAIPKITNQSPCIRLSIRDGKIEELSRVNKNFDKILRKYGNNQGTFPCMNLKPLYRIMDIDAKKEIEDLISEPEKINSKLTRIKELCRDENNNWDDKFKNKYKNICNKGNELCDKLPEFQPIQMLAQEFKYFKNPSDLQELLKNQALKMLSDGEDVQLALLILFATGKGMNSSDNLSVALETPKLVEKFEMNAISAEFVKKLNAALLSTLQNDSNAEDIEAEKLIDAFEVPFTPLHESMPMVQLAGGIQVSLRTMFEEHQCQKRYGKIEDASYPISLTKRLRFQACLEYIGCESNKNKTWIKISNNEILFSYPLQDWEDYSNLSHTDYLNDSGNLSSERSDEHRNAKKENRRFQTKVKQFLDDIRRGKKPGTDSHVYKIRVFILRKIDKGRSKMVYSRQTDAEELEKGATEWIRGGGNIPRFDLNHVDLDPVIPYPLNVAKILNFEWKRDQKKGLISFSQKHVSTYHGIELLMDPEFPTGTDLHLLSTQTSVIGPAVTALLKKESKEIKDYLQRMMPLIGLILYRNGYRKEKYMDEFPYLLGQLLKVSDDLHKKYCEIVRSNSYPPQFAGSSLYRAATESPIRTLNLLGQRMIPYIAWAKTYNPQKSEEGNKVKLVKYYLNRYREISDQLYRVWTVDYRLNDIEKAQLFIGYLASYPSKGNTGASMNIPNTESEETTL